MEIQIGEDSGFCFGVNNAVNQTIKVLEEQRDKSIYTYGELIHNKQVIEKLTAAGLKVINNINDIENNSSIIIIRSHGVSKEIYSNIKNLNIKFIDCTCPYVAKIHKIVNEHYNKGYKVLIAGDKYHPEVIGINGWCNNEAIVIQNEKIVDNLYHYDKICLVAQTTITSALWDQIANGIKERFDKAKIFNTRCKATESRQNAAKTLAQKVDSMIVIGGYNSSNTIKLYEICKENCSNTYHIETPDEISCELFKNIKSVGITAGASTPNWIIKEVINKMNDLNKENKIENSNDSHVEDLNDNFDEILEDNKAEDLNENIDEILNNNSTEELTTGEEDKKDSDLKENLMEEYEKSLVRLREGDTVKGTVLSLNEDEVIVNIGYKADGIINKKDLSSENDVIPSEIVSIGDEIEVKVVRINDGEGNVELSKRLVELDKNVLKLESAFNENSTVTGKVKEIVRGGGLVEIYGVMSFMPASLFDLRYVNDLDSFKDKEVSVRIIEFSKENKKIIVSRKAHIIEERKKLQEKFWEMAEEGKKIPGEVKRLTDFGAFVDIGGLDGLIHISELSWSRVNHPSEVLEPGDKVEVVILSLDKEKNKVSLGLKQTIPEPWTTIEGKYNIGDIIDVKIVRFANFGAFAEIEPGVDGLIHISQISEERIDKPSQVLEINEIVKVKIIDTNIAERKMSLSIIEAAEEN